MCDVITIPCVRPVCPYCVVWLSGSVCVCAWVPLCCCGCSCVSCCLLPLKAHFATSIAYTLTQSVSDCQSLATPSSRRHGCQCHPARCAAGSACTASTRLNVANDPVAASTPSPCEHSVRVDHLALTMMVPSEGSTRLSYQVGPEKQVHHRYGIVNEIFLRKTAQAPCHCFQAPYSDNVTVAIVSMCVH